MNTAHPRTTSRATLWRYAKPSLHLSGFLSACLLCSGCFPARFTTSPGATGLVLDSRTRAPISNAEVFVSKVSYQLPVVTNSVTGKTEAVPATEDQLVPPTLDDAVKKRRPPTVFTSSDGRFSIPPQTEWGIYIVPMDMFFPQGTLVIRREGYTNAMQFIGSPTNQTVDVGEVLLEGQK